MGSKTNNCRLLSGGFKRGSLTLWRIRLGAPALALALLLGLPQTGAEAQTVGHSAPPQAELPSPVQRHTLGNGMELIIKVDRRAPTAVHMLWVRAGAYDEAEGASGAAHVLEHMMFKGTKTLKPGEFSAQVAALGGQENAFTSQDYTGYYQQIPNTRLAEVMRLEADRFANNQWDEGEFAKELAVVKEERRMRIDDNPRARLMELLNATAFVASPYRRPVIGWMGDLDALTPADVQRYYRQWYSPRNAAVVVAGDVDPQQVIAMAEATYGQIPSSVVPARKPMLEPEQQGMRRVELKAVATQAYVALAFKVPQLKAMDDSAQTRDALALTVLSAVLDGYSGARLERALTQGPDRVADSAGSGNGLYGRGPQQFLLFGVPAPGKTPEQVEAALLAEVARVAEQGISAQELARVKTQWKASQVYQLDSLMSQARELGVAWVLGLPLNLSESLLQALDGITAAQVQDVARRYFVQERMTAAVLRPMLGEGRAAPVTQPAGQANAGLH